MFSIYDELRDEQLGKLLKLRTLLVINCKKKNIVYYLCPYNRLHLCHSQQLSLQLYNLQPPSMDIIIFFQPLNLAKVHYLHLIVLRSRNQSCFGITRFFPPTSRNHKLGHCDRKNVCANRNLSASPYAHNQPQATLILSTK